ncbi:interferon-induced protein 44-like isoform X2 [Chaetodon trifascialis]|uniref:interferon-induced protein 44-like isoform X2 n=1 Tax=Chaetodon trifascialis TaxID=109706 RepID=UPI003992253A
MSYFTAMGALFSQPWRAMPKDNQENLDFAKSYQPRNKEAQHLRILLNGPAGAGKSSFINSVDSVLQRKITGRALTDATFGSSFTRRYTTYKLCKDPVGFYSFVFNDIMGLERLSNNGVHVEDVKLALRGHVKEHYEFRPEHPLTESDLGYNPSPTLDEKVQVLVSVVPADTLPVLSDEIKNKMKDIRRTASDMGIPQLAVITKVDKACRKARQDVKNVYRSKYLKRLVDEFSAELGIPVNCIFLVKNYESEIKTNDDTDALILCALRQMISFGDDFLRNL